MNRSYYCRHCDKGYNTEGAQHHNCQGQNCSACFRRNKTCPNFAAWTKPTLHCPDCNCMFCGTDCFEAHKVKGEKRTDQSICESWKKCLLCCGHYHLNPKKNLINVIMSAVPTVVNLLTWPIDVIFSPL